MKRMLMAVSAALALLAPSAAAALEPTGVVMQNGVARVVEIRVSGDAAALARVRMTANELLLRFDGCREEHIIAPDHRHARAQARYRGRPLGVSLGQPVWQPFVLRVAAILIWAAPVGPVGGVDKAGQSQHEE